MSTAAGQKTFAAYATGFILCVLLTAAAFALVEKKLLAPSALYIALGGLALIQLFVQSVCFLRLNTSAEGKWNLMPFLFTLLLIVILVGGSLWIMYHLNYNM